MVTTMTVTNDDGDNDDGDNGDDGDNDDGDNDDDDNDDGDDDDDDNDDGDDDDGHNEDIVTTMAITASETDDFTCPSRQKIIYQFKLKARRPPFPIKQKLSQRGEVLIKFRTPRAVRYRQIRVLYACPPQSQAPVSRGALAKLHRLDSFIEYSFYFYVAPCSPEIRMLLKSPKRK
ncbi:hypothetical protein EVAR_51935_1 [Eumeta japonica]|uniref:Uncharacterized protein n=1 Tax=Eumeta variegata TaxID=151549 RepID=A0A4C1YGQ6_EUMVA|nr:hypothetical protein EVAR_51935_1 [Eumeta japonica]